MKQPEHSQFAFSASPRWIPCPGSMAYPENTAQGDDAGEYAAEGTAAHTLAAECLKGKYDAVTRVGEIITVGARQFTITDDFADHVQTYVDDVRRRAMGGYMMTEQRVSLDGVEGFDASNYGTSDAVIAIPARRIMAMTEMIFLHGKAYGVVEDLKFGQGEKVYAWIPAYEGALFTMTMYRSDEDGEEEIEVEPNYQLMMYALACLADIRLLIDEPKGILIVINQPRLGILSELWVPIAVLERFALFAAEALYKAKNAMTLGVRDVERQAKKYLNPGEKQCRWCKVVCPARTAKAEAETAADFDIVANTPPTVPQSAEHVAKAMLAVPFVADWCRAVMAKAAELVTAGTPVIGPDKKPYKFVEGDLGKRKWKNAKAAEEALLANLPREKVYKETMITAPAAGKILNKKATKETWTDIFEPLIGRAPGKPILALGSDARPPYSPVSEADEFDVEEPSDE